MYPTVSLERHCFTADGTIQGELLASKSKLGSKGSGLLSYEWRRVILDESHCIKNPATAVSRACCTLKAGKRWCKFLSCCALHEVTRPSGVIMPFFAIRSFLICHALFVLLCTGVTGTPIQNSLQDVYALIKFLQHEPWCENGFWKAAITNASTEGNGNDDKTKPGSTNGNENEGGAPTGTNVALDRVKRLLAPLILRRTKDTLNKDG